MLFYFFVEDIATQHNDALCLLMMTPAASVSSSVNNGPSTSCIAYLTHLSPPDSALSPPPQLSPHPPILYQLHHTPSTPLISFWPIFLIICWQKIKTRKTSKIKIKQRTSPLHRRHCLSISYIAAVEATSTISYLPHCCQFPNRHFPHQNYTPMHPWPPLTPFLFPPPPLLHNWSTASPTPFTMPKLPHLPPPSGVASSAPGPVEHVKNKR